MNLRIRIELEKIQITGARCRSISLYQVFNEIITETRMHDNTKKAIHFCFDELIERMPFHEDESYIYYDCLYLFCNACNCKIFKPKEIESKFYDLIDRMALENAMIDQDTLWKYLYDYYKHVSIN